MEKIGLQLYSVKELTQVDFFGVLRKLGKMGYNGVEFAGYFGASAKELKKVLDEAGLEAAGSHIGIDQFQNNFNELVEYNLEIGNRYVVCPWLAENMRNSADACKRTAELFDSVGEKCRKQGLQFAYHNHDFEFDKFNGEHALDIFVNNTKPEHLHIELDTFWVEYTGLRSVDFMKKYGERCSLIHIKDMKSFENKINTEIGKGVMDFKEITALGKKLNAKWYTVEQEEFEIPQLQSVEESLNYLRSIL